MRFKATPRSIANSHVVTVPSDYIKNRVIEPGKEYWFDIQGEVEDAE